MACVKERFCKYIAPLNHPESPLISSLLRYFHEPAIRGLGAAGNPRTGSLAGRAS